MEKERTTEFKKNTKQSKKTPKFRFDSDLSKQKILLCFFNQIDQPEKALEPKDIPIKDLVEFCGFNNANPYRTVRLASLKLSKEVLEYKNEKQSSYAPWFKYIRYRNGIISYQFNDAIVSELLPFYKHKNPYVKIDPRLIVAFKNKYALRLYLMLKNELFNHKMSIPYSLQIIHSAMTLSPAYNPKNKYAVSNQKFKIIQPAVEEINKISDIHVEYEPTKFGKKIIGWKFDIKTQPVNFLKQEVPLQQ